MTRLPFLRPRLTRQHDSPIYHLAGKTYALQSPQKAYSYTRLTDNSHRFEVMEGDQQVSGYPDPPGVRHRCEMSSSAFNVAPAFGTEFWLAYSLMVERTVDPSPTFAFFGQFHATEDAGDTHSPPAFSVAYLKNTGDADGVMRLQLSGTPDAIHTVDPPWNYQTSITCPYNIWQNYVVRIIMSPFGAGELQVWRGTDFGPCAEIFNQDGLTIGYNDQITPYFKFGVYCEDVGSMAVRYTTPEWSTTSLFDRVANPARP